MIKAEIYVYGLKNFLLCPIIKEDYKSRDDVIKRMEKLKRMWGAKEVEANLWDKDYGYLGTENI